MSANFDKEPMAMDTDASREIGLGTIRALLEHGYRALANPRTFIQSKESTPSSDLGLAEGDIGKKESAISVADAALNSQKSIYAKLSMEQPTKNERDIRRIITAGTAVAFGCMAASLETLRPSPGGVSFQITPLTFLAFVLGAAALVPLWRIVFNLVSGNRRRPRHVLAVLLLLPIGLAAFLYPSRFVPSEKLHDMYTGLSIAVCALSLVASLVVLIGRFFGADNGNARE